MIIKDRTFIITGGASGLGLATAKDFIAQGANVGILDMRPTTQRVYDELGRSRARIVIADVTDSEGLQKALDSLADWTKETGKPLGGVVTAAGVGRVNLLVNSKIEPVAMSKLDVVLDTNVRGVLNFIRLCLPHMIRTEPSGPDGERGVIIMVSSVAAEDGTIGQSAYAASKGAVKSLTLVLARELARYGIRCMSIGPGMFDTPMAQQGLDQKTRDGAAKVPEFPKRFGNPAEFAMLARHCVENPMLNGTYIRLDAAARFPAKV